MRKGRRIGLELWRLFAVLHWPMPDDPDLCYQLPREDRAGNTGVLRSHIGDWRQHDWRQLFQNLLKAFAVTRVAAGNPPNMRGIGRFST